MNYDGYSNNELKTLIRDRGLSNAKGEGTLLVSLDRPHLVALLQGTYTSVTDAHNAKHGLGKYASYGSATTPEPTPAADPPPTLDPSWPSNTTSTPAPAAPATVNGPEVQQALGALAAALATGVKPEDVMRIVLDPANDLMAKVKEAAEAAAAAVAPIPVHVYTAPHNEPVNVGTQHHAFKELVLDLASPNLRTQLVGPAGTGKTRGVSEAAAAIGRKFYYTAVCPTTSEAKLLGFIDAAGNYHRTPLRDAYENGGIFLLDEMDNGNASILSVLNAILDGTDGFYFPDGYIERHELFKCVSATNTIGKGADRIYCGRAPLDGATLDRFTPLEWSYDTKLEAQLLARFEHPDKSRWIDYVEKVRDGIHTHKIRHIAGYRSKEQGLELLERGTSWEAVVERALRKGLPEEQWNKIK